jgi:glycerol-3-phosphate dehydrogenase (NAD(P)+)
MKPVETKLSVLGAGSWGTALANILALNGHKVDLWSVEEDVLTDIKQNSENKKYHPGLKLDSRINPVWDLEEAVSEKTFITLALPTHIIREVLSKVRKKISKDCVLISAAKGIENNSLKTVSELILDELPGFDKSRVAALSGPSFATEVIKQLPAAVTIASVNHEVAKEVQKIYHSDLFRTYTTDDIMGVELGGALKNVIAIAVGASDGLMMGYNARAALITRGAAEITRVGLAKGANPLTFLGLAGMGDLILTCTSHLSRNWTVGFKIGQGQKLETVLKGMKQVVEGVKTAKSAHNLAKKLNVQMPISEQVYLMLYESKDPKDVIVDLTARDPKQERY